MSGQTVRVLTLVLVVIALVVNVANLVMIQKYNDRLDTLVEATTRCPKTPSDMTEIAKGTFASMWKRDDNTVGPPRWNFNSNQEVMVFVEWGVVVTDAFHRVQVDNLEHNNAFPTKKFVWECVYDGTYGVHLD